MKVLATLGLTLASSTAFAGLVYVVTPVVEELCYRSPLKPGERADAHFVGQYRGSKGTRLSLTADGTYSHTTIRPMEEGEVHYTVSAGWSVQGPDLVLEGSQGGARRLRFDQSAGITTLSDEEEVFQRVESTHAR